MDAEILSDKPVYCKRKFIDRDSSNFSVISIEIDLKNLRGYTSKPLSFAFQVYLSESFIRFRFEYISEYHNLSCVSYYKHEDKIYLWHNIFLRKEIDSQKVLESNLRSSSSQISYLFPQSLPGDFVLFGWKTEVWAIRSRHENKDVPGFTCVVEDRLGACSVLPPRAAPRLDSAPVIGDCSRARKRPGIGQFFPWDARYLLPVAFFRCFGSRVPSYRLVVSPRNVTCASPYHLVVTGGFSLWRRITRPQTTISNVTRIMRRRSWESWVQSSFLS